MHSSRGLLSSLTHKSQWIARQCNDPFVAARQVDGYRSRAAYKLLELDLKHKILHKDSHVLDLGCAPGGWAQVAAQRSASVTGIDLLPMDHIPGVHFVQGSLLDPQTLDRLLSLHKKQLFDVVLSDMAPEFSGSPSIDIPRSQDLARKALDLCLYPLLRPGGSIVLKYFQGEGDGELVKDFKKCFKMVRIEKPKASRRGSREGFLVCSKFSRPGVVNVSRII